MSFQSNCSTRKFLESRHVRFLEKLVYNDVYIINKSDNLQKEKEIIQSMPDHVIEFAKNKNSEELSVAN